MKKLICAVLTLILLLLPTLPAFAEGQLPVVFVAGYTSSRLYLDHGKETEKQVWQVHLGDKVISAFKSELPKVIGSAAPASVGIYKPLFDALEPYVNEIIEPLSMNADGTSVYDVQPYPHAVSDTRLDKCKAARFYPDSDHMRTLTKAVGDKNAYICTLDWRLGQVDNAAVLNDYIEEVVRVTGSEKINLFGVSYGGQVCASYLSLYGGDRVARAVLHCPALDGSSIVPALLSGEKFSFCFSELLKMYDVYKDSETDYHMLTDIVNLKGLDPLLLAFAQRFLVDFFVNFGSVWDLVPLKDYDRLKAQLLNDGEHEKLIEKSDIYHYEIAAKRAETFRMLEAEGVKLAIVAGFGHELVVKSGLSSDGVIELASTTGAKCAYKERPDYSTCYLPERTWAVDGMVHAMGVKEEKVETLMIKLLTGDEIESVHSSPLYPQTLTSQSFGQGVFAAFSSCSEGFLTPYSTELEIKNLSAENNVIIDRVSCKGSDLSFEWDRSAVLAPGETLTARVSGKLPDDGDAVTLKILYITDNGKVSYEKCREQTFETNSGSLYSEILLPGVDEGSPKIPAGRLSPVGSPGATAFFARLGYYLYRLFAFLSFQWI